MSTSATPFGISLDEVAKHLEDDASLFVGRNVCACGHSMKRHQRLAPDLIACCPARMFCPCSTPIPVVEVSDTRYFLNKTIGWGHRHALTMGLYRLINAGGEVKEVIERRCMKCGESSDKLTPTSLNSNFFIVEQPGEHNALLCDLCWSDFPRLGKLH